MEYLRSLHLCYGVKKAVRTSLFIEVALLFLFSLQVHGYHHQQLTTTTTTRAWCSSRSNSFAHGQPTLIGGFSNINNKLSSAMRKFGVDHEKRCSMTMKIKVGIVGLPNVGKSSLFNSLAKQTIALAANYPFATIEPNVSPVVVPDEYLDQLGALAGSKTLVPATIQCVDVAGLVKGASRGEGLGNKFLATVRETDAICHLVRMFDNDDIIHVDGAVDPVSDAEVINLELILADLAHIERRLEKSTCKGEERKALEKVHACLHDGKPARAAGLSDEAAFSIKSMGLLTLKPVLYVFNVDEIDFLFGRKDAMEKAKRMMESIQYCDPSVDLYTIVSAKFEAEIATKTSEETKLYLQSLGVVVDNEASPNSNNNNNNEEDPLEDEGDDNDDDLCFSYNVIPNMIQQLLGLSLIYTGPGVPTERSQTTKAHLLVASSTTTSTTTAIDLAGKLHGDIQRGFIRSEVVKADKLLEYESFSAAREAGCVRIEGKDYLLRPKDVIFIRWK